MSDTLLQRTAKALYRADEAPKSTDWSHLPRPTQRRYEVMAAASLSVLLSEKVEYPDLSLVQ
jgi:hypothetical protein